MRRPASPTARRDREVVFRKPLLYPLSYGGVFTAFAGISFEAGTGSVAGRQSRPLLIFYPRPISEPGTTHVE